MKPLDNYHAGTANWREVIRQNKNKSRLVIFSFIAIYMLVGFLLDLVIYAEMYPRASISTILHALMTLQLEPIATIIAGIVAIISIWITISFHNKIMLFGTDYHEITAENAKTFEEKQLYNTVEEMKLAAGLSYMPRVYIINAEYMNAFASGYTEKSAMVAITKGLLEKLDRDETTAVMAHELSHIKHLDIKLTLVATVLANLIVTAIDIVFYNVLFSSNRNSENSKGRANLYLIIVILRFILPLITVILLMFLSRSREYMADAGCVELMRNNEPLARALMKIQSDHEENEEKYSKAYESTSSEAFRREAYIFDPVLAGIDSVSSVADFFSTHPGINNRLKALGFTAKKS